MSPDRIWPFLAAVALLGQPAPCHAQSDTVSGAPGSIGQGPRSDPSLDLKGLIPITGAAPIPGAIRRPAPMTPGGTNATTPANAAASSTAEVATPMACIALAMTADAEPAPWLAWWERNRARFLDVRESIVEATPISGGTSEIGLKFGLQPSLPQLNALDSALTDAASGASLDLVVEALLSMGELDELWSDRDRRSRLREWVWRGTESSSRPVVDAAYTAIACGASDADSMALGTLLRDEESDEEARRAAALGLSRIATRTERDDVRRLAAHFLVRAYEELDGERPRLGSATLIALATIPLEVVGLKDPGGVPEPVGTSRLSVLRFLLAELDRHRRLDDELLRNLPAALAIAYEGLPGTAREASVTSIATPLLQLVERPQRISRETREGLVRALGAFGDCSDSPIQERLREALWAATDEADLRNRTAAYIALAQCLSRPDALDASRVSPDAVESRAALARRLTRGRSTDRPAVALALGLGSWHLRQAGQVPPPIWTMSLRSALGSASGPEERVALALALGLANDVESEARLLEILESLPQGVERTYVALALGFTGSSAVLTPLREQYAELAPDPALSARMVEALGCAGDVGVASRLWTWLDEESDRRGRLELLAGLSRVGRVEHADLPLGLAADTEGPSEVRSAALFASGRILAPEPLEWIEPLTRWLTSDGQPLWPGEEFGWSPFDRQ